MKPEPRAELHPLDTIHVERRVLMIADVDLVNADVDLDPKTSLRESVVSEVSETGPETL